MHVCSSSYCWGGWRIVGDLTCSLYLAFYIVFLCEIWEEKCLYAHQQYHTGPQQTITLHRVPSCNSWKISNCIDASTWSTSLSCGTSIFSLHRCLVFHLCAAIQISMQVFIYNIQYSDTNRNYRHPLTLPVQWQAVVSSRAHRICEPKCVTQSVPYNG